MQERCIDACVIASLPAGRQASAKQSTCENVRLLRRPHHSMMRPPRNDGKERSLVMQLYRRLYAHFGPQHWWPGDTPWEVMVGAILTQNTAWTNVEKAIAQLKRDRTLAVSAIASMPRSRLARLIRASGYFRQKAKKLQLFAREMLKDKRLYQVLRGHAIPSPSSSPQRGEEEKDYPSPPLCGGEGPPRNNLLSTWAGPVRGGRGKVRGDLRQRLLSLYGIGPETADSILLYAGGYPVFVVDAYTRRIGQRMGLFRAEDYHQVQAFFERSLVRSAKLYNEFHALLVALGKYFCLNRNPKCAPCPARPFCVYGQRQVQA